MPHSTSRRRFLKLAAAGSIASTLRPALLRATPSVEKLQHAAIGVGGMGWPDLHEFVGHPNVEVVALCDVDANNLERAKKWQTNARVYTDWRELFAAEGDRIDSVNITVPDHMHAPIAMTALRAGKHVYCQKPLCHDVAEVRAITEAAGNTDLVTQLGTQRASGLGDRMAVALLKQGVIGKIKHVYLCSNRPGAIENYRLAGPRPETGEKPPSHLNWDLWIGTAPMRPYSPAIYHPVQWRGWQDFGTGWSGDVGCHVFDAVWKALDLTAPQTVTARVQESWANDPRRRNDNWPQSDHIVWTFSGNEWIDGDALTVEWHDGEFYSPPDVRKIIERDDYPSESALLLGTEGAMLVPHGREPELFPSKKFKDLARPEFQARNHYHHFVDACLGEAETESHFAETGPMTEAILLGTVAIRVPNKTLQWDAEKLKIVNDHDAERFLSRTYRDGWRMDGL